MKMRRFYQGKLFRDNIVEMLEKQGSSCDIKHLNDADYGEQLGIKIIEEAQEVCSAKSKEELIEELADVFEVIDALCLLNGFTKDQVVKAQEKKRELRGGFFKRIFVQSADHPEGSFGEKYCLERPDKYPEIEKS